jgi:hypothetical protein
VQWFWADELPAALRAPARGVPENASTSGDANSEQEYGREPKQQVRSAFASPNSHFFRDELRLRFKELRGN